MTLQFRVPDRLMAGYAEFLRLAQEIRLVGHEGAGVRAGRPLEITMTGETTRIVNEALAMRAHGEPVDAVGIACQLHPQVMDAKLDLGDQVPEVAFVG